MGDYTVLGRWAISFLYGTARLSHDVLIMGDYTVLGRWAISFSYWTARLSCVDLG